MPTPGKKPKGCDNDGHHNHSADIIRRYDTHHEGALTVTPEHQPQNQMINSAKQALQGLVASSFIMAAIGALITGFSFFPGYLSFDSAYQYWMARTSHFDGVSPTLYLLLFSLSESIFKSSYGMFLLNIMIYWTGLLIFSYVLKTAGFKKIFLVTLAGIWLPTFTLLGHIWTDTTLLAALTLASALLGLIVITRKRRYFFSMVILLVVAGSIRHNALLAVLPLFWLAWRSTFQATNRSHAVLATLVFVFSVVALGQMLDRIFVKTTRAVWPTIALWDLAGISVRVDELLLPEFAYQPGLTVQELRETNAYTPYSNTPLYTLPHHWVRDGLGGKPYSRDEQIALASVWANSILAHPSAYLEHRATLALGLFGRHNFELGGGLVYAFHIVSFKDNPPIIANDSSLTKQVEKRIMRLRKSWIFSPLPYILICLGAILISRRFASHPLARASIAIAASALFYVAPLAIIAPSAELRYCGWLFPAAFLSLLFAWTARKSEIISPSVVSGNFAPAVESTT